MFKFSIALTLSLFIWLSAFTQSARIAGLGYSSAVMFDIWSASNNQAGLATITNPTIAIGYANKFQLNELSTQSAIIGIPTKTGNFAVNYQRFGYSLYSENSFGLAYARKLGEIISAGLQFDYLHYQQTEDYGNHGVFLMEAGLIAEPINNFYIGVHIYNPWNAKLAEYNDERISSRMQFGLGYCFSEQVLFTIETEKTLNQKARFKGGIEYEPLPSLFLRTGIGTQPNQFSFGVGYTLWDFTTDIAFVTHETLPVSTEISIKYVLNK